jgi:hypothetical protein
VIGATEFYATTPGLNVILWVEAVIYLSIGAYELLDDFAAKPKAWMHIDGRPNSYLMLQHKVGHKMHAGLCFVLGMVALNGAVEGVVTRFELELIFISFAVILPVLWATLLPGRLGITVLLLKPEFWLQGLMLIFYSDLIRIEILWLCIALNLWGIVVYFLNTRRSLISPYEYATLRRDVIAAEGEATAVKFDKLAGYSAAETSSNPPLDNQS